MGSATKIDWLELLIVSKPGSLNTSVILERGFFESTISPSTVSTNRTKRTKCLCQANRPHCPWHKPHKSTPPIRVHFLHHQFALKSLMEEFSALNKRLKGKKK